jgi:hypothetical protein
MFREGKSIEEIATERAMTAGTIEGHLSRYITTGEIKVTDVVPKDLVHLIAEELKKHDGPGAASTAKAALPEAITYGMIRAVSAHLARNKETTANM